MNNRMDRVDRGTLEHLSKYGIFEPSTSKSILGTLTVRQWSDQSFEEKLNLLAYADLITGVRLPRFSRTRRQAALSVLIMARSRSLTEIGRRPR